MESIKDKLTVKMSATPGKKKTIWFTGAEIDILDEIIEATGATQSAIIREGLALVLAQLKKRV